MEKVDWKVEGMTCTNCALTINRYLEKEGLKDVKVNFIGGEVSFELNGNHTKDELTKGIADLGYKVVNEQQTTNNNIKTYCYCTRYCSVVRCSFFLCIIFIIFSFIPSYCTGRSKNYIENIWRILQKTQRSKYRYTS